jgi:hypothetical protein
MINKLNKLSINPDSNTERQRAIFFELCEKFFSISDILPGDKDLHEEVDDMLYDVDHNDCSTDTIIDCNNRLNDIICNIAFELEQMQCSQENIKYDWESYGDTYVKRFH